MKNIFSLQNINPAGWPRGNKQNPTETALAVFDVGETIPRIHQKLCADLVTLNIPTLRVGRAESNKTQQKTALAVFDVGEANLRIRQRLNADLVTLSEAGVE